MSERNPFADEEYRTAWNKVRLQIWGKARQGYRPPAKKPLKWWQTMIFWEHEKKDSIRRQASEVL